MTKGPLDFGERGSFAHASAGEWPFCNWGLPEISIPDIYAENV